MNQLLITDRFLPHQGGSRVYYYQVCRHFNIRVLTRPETDAPEFDKKQSFSIHRRWGIRPETLGRFRPRNRWLNLLFNYVPPALSATFWTLIEILHKKPQIIHVGGFLLGGLPALTAKKLFGIKWLVYAHGEEIHSQAGSRTVGGYLRWIYTSADAVIANSEFTCGLLTERVGVDRTKIHLVHPGVDKIFFVKPDACEEIRNKHGLVGKKVLLTVGRLTQRKGQAQVLKSLPELINQFPDLMYVIAGEGEASKSLKELTITLKLEKHVIFTGSVSGVEHRALYYICDLFILANRELKQDVEGFGMVFIEANAAGKPVIGGRSGGAIEAIDHDKTGFLIDTENISEIKDSVQHLLEDPDLRKRLGENGQQWAKHFLWEKQFSKISKLLHQLTQESPQ